MEIPMKEFGTKNRMLFRTIATLGAVVGMLWPYMFSIASTSETTFSLINHTHYYLHASINNQTFVYIAPGGTIALNVEAPTSVYARVRYSPGQTVRGTGERTIDIQATTTSTGGTSTCQPDNHHGETCTGTDPVSTTTTDPARWDVLPTDVTTDKEDI